MHLARHLVQGADVWLNTPRRPFEACGTSGMKAAINGALNFSILDGWWCEGYREDVGWSIGNGEEYEDHAYQDAVESQALYNILENEVVPCFYDRKNGDLPTALDREDEGVDEDGHGEVLQPAHGHRLRRQALRPRGPLVRPAAGRRRRGGPAARRAGQERVRSLWKGVTDRRRRPATSAGCSAWGTPSR
ncbi:MAG: hypothetical protein MZV70_56320 [Desulfobacterales bacterium]|nr:hypothetical protein [Desulfobacterales bacterium]